MQVCSTCQAFVSLAALQVWARLLRADCDIPIILPAIWLRRDRCHRWSWPPASALRMSQANVQASLWLASDWGSELVGFKAIANGVVKRRASREKVARPLPPSHVQALSMDRTFDAVRMEMAFVEIRQTLRLHRGSVAMHMPHCQTTSQDLLRRGNPDFAESELETIYRSISGTLEGES